MTYDNSANLMNKEECSMANNSNTSNRGFASMDEDKQREIASQGGRAQGKENNPANFANDKQKAKRAGHNGGSK
jgi:general stress protein YciG